MRASNAGVAKSSPEIVARKIVRGLYAGQFVPGQRLVEADLTRTFGVGRSTIREAFKHLASEGLVRLTMHKGAYIKQLTRKEATDSLRVLEANLRLLVRLATAAIDDSGRRRLRRQSAQLMAFRQSADHIGFIRTSNAFVITLMRIAGNGELTRLLPLMHVPLVRMLFRSFPPGPIKDTRFDNYREITEAILAGDEAAADIATHDLIDRFLRAVDQFPDSSFHTE